MITEPVPAVLLLHLTLEQPVLCTTLAGDANSMESFPYIPGSALRGALVAAYARRYPQRLQQSDPQYAEFRRLFFGGEVRYLNAYPTVAWGGRRRRTLPTPRSYFADKYRPEPIADAARLPEGTSLAGALAASDGGRRDQADPKRVVAPFCHAAANESGVTGRELIVYTPRRHLSVHISRARGTGRPEAGDGAVFRYDALAPRQSFTAIIHGDAGSEAEMAVLRGVLADTPRLMLGAARSAGYGTVRVETEEVTPETREWREVGAPAPAGAAGQQLAITFLAPTLVRDRWGQSTVAPSALAEQVAWALALPSVPAPARQQFIGAELVGGFNRTWGLPLVQEYAVAMGSVLLLQRTDSLDAAAMTDRLRALERDGLGDRRVEGFGRIAIGWPAVSRWQTIYDPNSDRRADDLDADDLDADDLDADAGDTDPASAGVGAPTDAAIATAGEVTTGGASGDRSRGRLAPDDVIGRLVLRRLDERLLTRAAELATLIRGPKASQLTRLRGAVQQALAQPPEEGRAALRRYLGAINERKVVRTQFERDRIGGGTTLLGWLQARVDDRQTIWRELGWDETNPLTAALPNPGAFRSEDLAYSYNLRLVDAVLARAAKHIQQRAAQQRRENEQSEPGNQDEQGNQGGEDRR